MDLLELFGQFDANRRHPVPQDVVRVVEELGDALGRLEDDERVGQVALEFEEAAARPRLSAESP